MAGNCVVTFYRTSELVRTPSEIFGCLRKSSEIFGYVCVVFEITAPTLTPLTYCTVASYLAVSAAQQFLRTQITWFIKGLGHGVFR